MATVKNQVYDGSEETYTDANGVIHYFGELFRHIMTDAYPLPLLNPRGVSRKSPRGHKPTQQGTGSPRQLIYRMCFSECAARWNSLPAECPEKGTCNLTSSKANVWDGKTSQGVMCSYLDLYMACCLSYCTEITITGPGGSGASGGAIPEDLDCFPCPRGGGEGTLEIEYESNQLFFDQSMGLYAYDSLEGPGHECCEGDEITWSLSGGGEINPTKGGSTTYKAPSSNGGCANNASITAQDACGRTATVEIAVTSGTHGAGQMVGVEYSEGEIFCWPGTEFCQPCVLVNCAVIGQPFDCQGADVGAPCSMGGQISFCVSEDACWGGYFQPACYITQSMSLSEVLSASPKDFRNEAAKDAGCCPAQF